MKVLTIKQPWASLIANGYKKYEFRSWQTKYRGPLLIHAGKGVDKEALLEYKLLNLDYPTSKVIALVELVDCILIDKDFNEELSKNSIYGESNKEGLYAWKITSVKKINNSEYIKGQLGLWNIENL